MAEARHYGTLFTPEQRGGSGTPMVCIHGFTDTWRSWELVLPRLERQHDVLAPTLPGHAGGPLLEEPVTEDSLPDAVERAMDRAGMETAHIVGNSLGGFVALQLASRGRAESVVALAPAGGWADEAYKQTLEMFPVFAEQLKRAAPNADAIVATAKGRRRATQLITTNFEHIPHELLAHQLRGAAACDGMLSLVQFAQREGYRLDAGKITCPVRMIWGTEDMILPWPSTAARYRDGWIPQAEIIELDGIGHCPQLDVPLETAELITGFTAR